MLNLHSGFKIVCVHTGDGFSLNFGFTNMCRTPEKPPAVSFSRKCNIPMLQPNGRAAVQTFGEHSFHINRSRLFNSLPKELRNLRIYQEDFKEALDKYLTCIPDQPRIGSLVPEATDQLLTGRQSNSLLAWATTINYTVLNCRRPSNQWQYCFFADDS